MELEYMFWGVNVGRWITRRGNGRTVSFWRPANASDFRDEIELEERSLSLLILSGTARNANDYRDVRDESPANALAGTLVNPFFEMLLRPFPNSFKKAHRIRYKQLMDGIAGYPRSSEAARDAADFRYFLSVVVADAAGSVLPFCVCCAQLQQRGLERSKVVRCRTSQDRCEEQERGEGEGEGEGGRHFVCLGKCHLGKREVKRRERNRESG